MLFVTLSRRIAFLAIKKVSHPLEDMRLKAMR